MSAWMRTLSKWYRSAMSSGANRIKLHLVTSTLDFSVFTDISDVHIRKKQLYFILHLIANR